MLCMSKTALGFGFIDQIISVNILALKLHVVNRSANSRVVNAIMIHKEHSCVESGIRINKKVKQQFKNHWENIWVDNVSIILNVRSLITEKNQHMQSRDW